MRLYVTLLEYTRDTCDTTSTNHFFACVKWYMVARMLGLGLNSTHKTIDNLFLIIYY